MNWNKTAVPFFLKIGIMNINKNLCEQLYSEVKNKLQEEFTQRGMTYKGSETSIWKLENPKKNKTYFQQIVEDVTHTSFTTTFNNMYLWRKRNETQQNDVVNFREDYLQVFIKFLGYANPQAYVNEFSLTLHNFFGIQKEGKIIVIQPIFDANKDIATIDLMGKFPLANEQTHDSGDTECLLKIINLFHDYNQTLPKRIYDQDLVQFKNGKLQLNEIILKQNKTNCIFSIGFYSNYFTLWFLENHANSYIDYQEKPLRFRIRYFNQQMQKTCWTDFYECNEQFDTGFLMKLPVKLSYETLNCYFFCGIFNKGTQAITHYLCENWKTIQERRDFERNTPLVDAPFIMVFKVNKNNIAETYIDKVVKIDF